VNRDTVRNALVREKAAPNKEERPMTDKKNAKPFRDIFRALSRWDDEGGAQTEQENQAPEDPQMSNAELVQLRVRVIALENIVLALLSESPEKTHEKVREMAKLISPRADATQHPLTTEAASHMNRFADRAARFRS